MIRYSPLLLICVSAVSAQTKKILVEGGEAFARELQSVSSEAHIVRVTPSTVMREIGGADAFIGNISPAEMRAAKELEMGAGDERRRRKCAFHVGLNGIARQRHRSDQ
jgi:hypothetical protein